LLTAETPQPQPSLAELESSIRACWSAETSHDPATWSASNPSAGQCWTTAYVVRHFFGGDIVLAEVLPLASPVERHAWNKLPCGSVVDMTKDQFPPRQAFQECEVPEQRLVAASGKQAELLLRRVKDLVEPA
jgi:hypothetical protein